MFATRDARPAWAAKRSSALGFGCPFQAGFQNGFADTSPRRCVRGTSGSRATRHESPFQPRAAISVKDARTHARELLAMTQDEFSAEFKRSPMKRAKLRGLKRNAAVVLGNVRTPDDVDVLTRALDDDEPLVREHAAWALTHLRDEGARALQRKRSSGD